MMDEMKESLKCDHIIVQQLDRMAAYIYSYGGARGPISHPSPQLVWNCTRPYAHGGTHSAYHDGPRIEWND